MGDDELEDLPDTNFVDSDDDGEFEAVDYRFLAQKKDYTIPSRGEKDFEPDGTNKQDRVLQASRHAMYDALSVERDISGKNYIRAVWHAELGLAQLPAKDAKGTMFKGLGRTDAKQDTWLLPEELLYMVERGNLECFYQHKEVPMSLQAAYAECIPHIDLNHFQVYAYLKRAGFMVLRSSFPTSPSTASPVSRNNYLSLKLTELQGRLKRALCLLSTPQTGLIDRNTTYRSFVDVYRRLSLVDCHVPRHHTNYAPNGADNPFRVCYDVWKPNTNFKKSAPGDPTFRVAVIDSHDHGVFTLQQINALFASIPVEQKFDSKSQAVRLKEGCRTFVLAIVDMGVVSFLSIGDVGFGGEAISDSSIVPKRHKGAQRSKPRRP